MSVPDEIARLLRAKAEIKTEIEGKGVPVPSSARLDDYDSYVRQIEGSSDSKVDLFDVTYEVTTIDEVIAAVEAGKIVRLVYGEIIAPLVSCSLTQAGAKAPEPGKDAYFSYSTAKYIHTYHLRSDSTWRYSVTMAYEKPPTGIPSSDLADGVIPDVSSFITNSVNDLVNYYTKSETYTQAELQQLLSALVNGVFVPVTELPTASADTFGLKIYLVPSPDSQVENQKDEYITIRSGSEGAYTYAWEKFGSSAIDLSGYVTTAALNTALAAYTTSADLDTLLSGKQGTISDLADIRTGAGLGATAYQKPSTGIPASDMASVVQTSLGKADTAYQKPSTGIPASDLASGVIPSVPTDVVKYSSQSLTTAQKTQARTNIGAGTYSKPSTGIPASDLASGVIPTVPTDIVKYTTQTLTAEQKAQARTNIGAGVPFEALTPAEIDAIIEAEDED